MRLGQVSGGVRQGVGEGTSRAVRVMEAFLRDPSEARERAAERLSEWKERRAPAYRYQPAATWESEFHALLDAPWPCRAHTEFEALWEDVTAELSGRGLHLGRGAFGGWDDADPALARAVWCSTLHARAETVVETGVARGITTFFILEALERGGAGHLWSIDIPPVAEPALGAETGAAVPDRLRHRWTYVAGSSRKRLPGLLARLETIDLFVHDSMHTRRNLDFELDQVWPALGPHGMAIVDDVQRSSSFVDFSALHADGRFLVGEADDGRALLGVARKPPNSWRASRQRLCPTTSHLSSWQSSGSLQRYAQSTAAWSRKGIWG